MAAQTHTKKLKNGTLQFYTGNRKATPQEKKAYLRQNIDSKVNLFNPETLNKEDRALYGRIKGGVNRAAKAATFHGKFLPDNITEKALKDLKIDFKNILREKGYDTNEIGKLFKDLPNLKNAFDNLISRGLEKWCNENTIEDTINDFSGKIVVNGKEVSKTSAINKVNRLINRLHRNLPLYYPGIEIQVFNVNLSELRLNIPSDDELSEIFSFEPEEGDNRLEFDYLTLHFSNSGEHRAKRNKNAKKNKKG